MVREYVVEAASQSEHCARTVTTVAFVFLAGEISAAILSFCSGFAAMVATVATVTLAADYCPPLSEGFTFALMMSIINLSTSLSGTFGAFLFDHVFHDSLTLLILSSAAFTAFAFSRSCRSCISATSARAFGRGDSRPGVNCTARAHAPLCWRRRETAFSTPARRQSMTASANSRSE